MKEQRRRLAGWGGLPRPPARLLRPSGAEDFAQWLRAEPGTLVGLRGLGRSYGDAATGDLMLDTTRLRGRFELDVERGCLTASAGWSLGEVLARTLPAGWAPAVLPGTRHVTLGGAVAADVHGKNHHVAGAFCRHVEHLRVLLADGRVVDCDRGREAGLFQACCGGMGLTGAILEVGLRLAPRRGGRFLRRTVACPDLELALRVLGESPQSHTVAWVDAAASGPGLGRALVYLGDPLDEVEAPRRAPGARLGLPGRPPVNLVRPALVRAFNELVWRGGRRQHGLSDVQAHGAFFWPLDAVAGWNRAYGPHGFHQFQCLLPAELIQARGAAPFQRLLELFLPAGGGSLAVMKTMGERDEGTAPIAFPGAGATLALDLPAGEAARAALKQAHRLVADWGGRVYLAKDAVLEAALFAAMTPGLAAWRILRDQWDPRRRWTTDLSRRLEL
ncbi:MAG: FAD-binding oxidoreductase [bacterium]|nr:FAD-binding oxidoreductase [bacterium]